jgi:integrase
MKNNSNLSATAGISVSYAADLDINLQRHAQAARGAYSANTERALRADIAVFTAWCADAGLAPLPAAVETVVGFIDAMAEIKAPATVRRYVSSIATFHRAAGVETPTGSLEVTLALKRLHRAKGRAQTQAVPLNRKRVERMLEHGAGTLRALRDRALLGVAYDTLCRRSELAALQLADLEHAPDGSGTVTIRRSKTDQEGAGDVRYVAPDTMRDLAAWISAAGVAEGRLFRSVRKGGRVGEAIDAGDVARVFKHMAESAGIGAKQVARISGHSSRVGAAQDMVERGIGLPAVMQAGGWKTAVMVSRYTSKIAARRGGAAQLAMAQGRE